jgi:predicted HTH transcriptional regulator
MVMRKNLKFNYYGLLGLIGLLGFKDPWYFLFFLFFLFFLASTKLESEGGIASTKAGDSPNLIERQAREKAEHLKMILSFAEARDKFANNDIQKLLGVSDATVTRYLDELEKQGKIRQVGDAGGYVYYQVIK